MFCLDNVLFNLEKKLMILWVTANSTGKLTNCRVILHLSYLMSFIGQMLKDKEDEINDDSFQ